MNFITVSEARKLIKKEIFNIQYIEKSLIDALYHYTAEDIYAPIDVPPFSNSAMDGYCFAVADFLKNTNLKIQYTIQTGDNELPILNEGEAARIYTGAPIPKNADTVIMQEKTKTENHILYIEDSPFKGQNIRKQGSQSRQGDKIISKHTLINTGVIGLLSNFGIPKIKVFKYPEIGILTTGNELVEAGKPLKEGQIYESNSITLTAALKELNINPVLSEKVIDDEEATITAIKKALEKTDILLITGGISVGDYDFVQSALQANEIETIFYKVQQKPGKPLLFGKKDKKYVFALPGNPASVLSCFYLYVKPFINGLKGNTDFELDKHAALLNSDFEKKNNLTNFLKGYYNNGIVEILSAQESYKMDSFAEANCLIEISGEKRTFKKDEKVTIWKI